MDSTFFYVVSKRKIPVLFVEIQDVLSRSSTIPTRARADEQMPQQVFAI